MASGNRSWANSVMTAVALMAEQFTRDDWMRLGLHTRTADVITNHPRLLRSLGFGDDDYTTQIWDVLPKVLGKQRDPETGDITLTNFERVETHLGLKAWLRENESDLFAAIYNDDSSDALDSALDDLVEAAEDHAVSTADIYAHAARIRRALGDDPAQMVGSAKELLETVCKSVLDIHGPSTGRATTVAQLSAQVQSALGIKPNATPTDPGARQRHDMLAGLNRVIGAIAELRNMGLATGHGASQIPPLDSATARLAAHAAIAVATFYLKLDDQRRNS
ncbi:abortive infection family protein [Mycobacteroides abscessus]|uniref:Abortive infection protein-like C-terminal domain-containing protein n=1 Tax=Mycobacteroides abscessus TaxID=36809 RepID=A0A0U0ZTW5_9MYCO|nr:abortive infection family protein [Mycobacteroides abscessus]CPV66336.1 Uncharacterised protein [Mycobacteroides abscessus]